MGQIKTKLIKTFYTLLHKTGLKQYKENIVLGFTEGKTTHISDLTPKDIKKLCSIIRKHNLPTNTNAERKTRLIRKIYALFRNAGYIYGSSEADNKMNTAKINAFLKEKGTIKKPLYKQSIHELIKTIRQFEAIYKKVENTRLFNDK